MNLFRKKVSGIMALSLAAGVTFTGTAAYLSPAENSSIYAVESSASSAFLSSAVSSTRCKVYNNETDTFMMDGRTYSQGVVLGDGKYENGSDITFDVTKLSSISFSLGHVDNSNSGSTQITIYLDDTPEDIITVTQDQPIIENYSVDVSGASTMKIVKTGSDTQYAIADVSVDSEEVKTYTVPSYKTSSVLVNSVFNDYRCKKFDETKSDQTFRMDGRTYSNGIVLGNGSYEDGAAFSLNVENINSLSMILGHVDVSNVDKNPEGFLSSTEFSVYLDNVLEEVITLTSQENARPYQLDVSSASTLRIVRTGGYSKYGVADITFDDTAPEKTAQKPVYKTYPVFLKSIYDNYRLTVFDGSSTALKFNMNGRSYYQGLVLGTGNYIGNSEFSINVEDLKNITFDIGHVDNTSPEPSTLTIYLDNEPVEKIKLSRDTPIEEKHSIDVSKASVMRIHRDGAYSQYALGNIVTENLAPKNSYSIPAYKNSAELINSIYDAERYSSYDGLSSAKGFNMQGRTYHQGVILGDGSYVEGSAVSFNVENYKTFSFDLGHVDNSNTGAAKFTIYLDGKEYKTIDVSSLKPIENVSIDVSDVKNVKVSRDGAYSQYAMANITADDLAPKNSYTVPENNTAKALVSSGYDILRSTVYSDVDQFTTFSMGDKDYTLGIILGNGSYEGGSAVSFNVEKLDSVSFSLGQFSEKQNPEEVLTIYRDGKEIDQITLTPENIAKFKNYTIDTKGTKTICISKNAGYTQYGLVDFAVKEASQDPSAAVTTPAVTAAPPASVTTNTAVSVTAPAATTVTSAAPVTTAVTTNVITPSVTTAAVTTAPAVTGGNGDTNGDGKVTTSDVRCILQFLVGSYDLKGDALKAADVDGNGSVNSADALKLLRKIAGVADAK